MARMDAADSDSARSAAEVAATRLEQRIKDRIGVSSRVRVAEVGAVVRSVGKAKRVVDLRV